MRLTFANTGRQTALSLLILAIFSVLVWLVCAASSSKDRSDQKRPLNNILPGDIGLTLSALRATQGVLSTLTAVAVDTSFQFLQWSLISQAQGLSYLDLLAMAPTTATLGAAKLLTCSHSTVGSRLWAVSR